MTPLRFVAVVVLFLVVGFGMLVLVQVSPGAAQVALLVLWTFALALPIWKIWRNRKEPQS